MRFFLGGLIVGYLISRILVLDPSSSYESIVLQASGLALLAAIIVACLFYRLGYSVGVIDGQIKDR
jgi:hypothetical protein